MAYFLDFDERALKEWRKLGSTVREQLKKKLVEVLESPRIEANKLRGMPDCYKIKLRSSGYRLVYQVIDEKVVVFVISVGKRERSERKDLCEVRIRTGQTEVAVFTAYEPEE
ncbi:type II toxin-antitoxin system mRNA interferase toxin, RelE/StbE family [Escherichia coli]|nr:type II toxin-antitoxin system mRNA interferase toxin, RelE/StbE family [Escherichia coli]